MQVSARGQRAPRGAKKLAKSQEDAIAELLATSAGSRATAAPKPSTDFVDFINSNTSPEAIEILQVNTPEFVNLVACGLVLGIVVLTGMGCYLGKRNWVFAMILASYAVLIPGLVSKDFSINVALVISELPLLPDTRMTLTSARNREGPIRESTRSLMMLLFENHNTTGGSLIATFALVVPAVKLLLIIFSEAWRNSAEIWKVRAARRSIVAVQLISKWASPDMFALILLYSLARAMHHPPFLESLQALDVGFSCYNLFCVFSVVSTLLVELPRHPDEEAEEDHSWGLLSQAKGSLERGGGLAAVVGLLTMLWGWLFVTGITTTTLKMSLDLNRLKEHAHNFPEVLVKALEIVGIEDMMKTDMSILDSSVNVLRWFRESGEVNLLLSAFMLGGFGIVLTFVNVFLLVLAALKFSLLGKSRDAAGRPAGLEGLLLRAVHMLRHLAMLDVCVVGVIVISFTFSIYKDQGIVLDLASGVWYAAASEAVHYLIYYLVLEVMEHTGGPASKL